MNHGVNHSLLEIDSKNRSAEMVARARRARRWQIVGPQSGEEPGLHANRLVRFRRVHSLELGAAAVAVITITAGIVSLVSLV